MVAKPRADQPGIDGIADECNNKINRAARHYVKMRDARMAASVVEKAAKNKIIECMEEEGFETYSYRDIEICLENKRNIKVTIDGKTEDDAEDDEE